MRLPTIAVVLAVCAALTACATHTTTAGKDFDTSKVAEIRKGITTSKDLVAMFGQPYRTTVKSESEVLWLFSWAKGTSKSSMGWTSPNVKTMGYKKNLTVLLNADVVVNYTLDEGPFERDSRDGKR